MAGDIVAVLSMLKAEVDELEVDIGKVEQALLADPESSVWNRKFERLCDEKRNKEARREHLENQLTLPEAQQPQQQMQPHTQHMLSGQLSPGPQEHTHVPLQPAVQPMMQAQLHEAAKAAHAEYGQQSMSAAQLQHMMDTASYAIPVNQSYLISMLPQQNGAHGEAQPQGSGQLHLELQQELQGGQIVGYKRAREDGGGEHGEHVGEGYGVMGDDMSMDMSGMRPRRGQGRGGKGGQKFCKRCKERISYGHQIKCKFCRKCFEGSKQLVEKQNCQIHENFL